VFAAWYPASPEPGSCHRHRVQPFRDWPGQAGRRRWRTPV